MKNSVAASVATFLFLASNAQAEPEFAIADGVNLMSKHVTNQMGGQLDNYQVVGAVENYPVDGAAFWITSRNGERREGTFGSPLYAGDTVLVSSVVADATVDVALVSGETVSLRGGDVYEAEANYGGATSPTAVNLMREVFEFTTRALSRGNENTDLPSFVTVGPRG